MYRAFDRREETAQCPNCPNGQCPLQDDRGYLLPYRQKQRNRRIPGRRWAARPLHPPTISAKLDKLIELQEKASARATQPPILPPSP